MMVELTLHEFTRYGGMAMWLCKQLMSKRDLESAQIRWIKQELIQTLRYANLAAMLQLWQSGQWSFWSDVSLFEGWKMGTLLYKRYFEAGSH